MVSQMHSIQVPRVLGEIQAILRHLTIVLLNPVEAAPALKPLFLPHHSSIIETTKVFIYCSVNQVRETIWLKKSNQK